MKIKKFITLNILTAERKKNVSRRVDEERRISPRGWRTTYLGARMKNDYLGGFTTSTWPVYGIKILVELQF